MTDYVVVIFSVLSLCLFCDSWGKHEVTVATYNIWNIMFDWEVRQLRIAQMVDLYKYISLLNFDHTHLCREHYLLIWHVFWLI